MDELLAGYHKFREQDFPAYRDLFRDLSERGQAPKALVVSCCDSRVDPQLIFGAKPGDLFVIRNVANLVPPYAPTADYHGTSAAIEFAIRRLGIGHLVVLGHSQCGGIRALLEEEPDSGDFIGAWVSIIREVRERHRQVGHEVTSEACRAAEFEGVRVSLDNLMTFPWIAERVKDGRLELHGYLFDVGSGELVPVDCSVPCGKEAAGR